MNPVTAEPKAGHRLPPFGSHKPDLDDEPPSSGSQALAVVAIAILLPHHSRLPLGNYTTLADMKRVCMAKKFSYL
ncbi:hypothetical protein MUK42_26758 [Musa troglodytarum]|uniref:Uncharacterized protein n=1 Tax=Musa troglodytarum TaxID=320322 RepID=A0A9E7JFP5_9LILI|nr:hypothetical protein MUK42_26758 [Musa troglodytarum]